MYPFEAKVKVSIHFFPGLPTLRTNGRGIGGSLALRKLHEGGYRSLVVRYGASYATPLVGMLPASIAALELDALSELISIVYTY